VEILAVSSLAGDRKLRPSRKCSWAH